MNYSLIIVIAAVAAILLGYLTRINIGLYALGFAYIIGAFMMDLSPSDIILGWPTEIFFILMTVSFFYNFATVNGTMEKLSDHIIYRFRNLPYLLPIILFVVSFVMSAMGAGMYAVFALMLPVSAALCKKTNMHFLLGAFAVTSGAAAGGAIITSVGGLVTTGLLMRAGMTDRSEAISYSMAMFTSGTIRALVGVAIAYVIFKGYAIKKIAVEKPEPMTKEQKLNIYIILAVMVACLLPAILSLFFRNNEVIAYINSKIDISFIAVIATIACILLKVGDAKKALVRVPWDTLIMIGGVGILIEVAVKAGVIDQLASWVGANVSPSLVPLALIVIAGAMSIFSAGYSVVMPTLFALVLPLAETTGVDPYLMFLSIGAAAFATGISPFSSGGSFVLSTCPDEETRNKSIPLMFGILVPINVILIIVMNYAGLYFRP